MRKVSLHWLLSFVIVCASIAVANAQAAGPQKGTLVTIKEQFEVKAPVAKVWKVLASAEGFGTLTGFQPDPAEKSKTLGALGSSVTAKIWSDKGRLITTHAVPEKELRVTWEPEKGNYLCAKRIVLKSTASGTAIEYWDRYTDDQAAASVDQTAKQVAAETKTAVAKFVALVEK